MGSTLTPGATRAPQPPTKLLVAGDSLTASYKQWLPADFDLVDAGGNGEGLVTHPWEKRLRAQLNTSWVPRAIVLQDWAIPGLNPANVTQQQWEDAFTSLVNAAQTSSATVYVLVGDINVTFTQSLPADQFINQLASDQGDGIHWTTATQKAMASIVANTVWSGA